jgi:DNA-binding NtrC family response regulator
MPPENLPRILCVDDDSNLLDGLTRSLRGHYRVETATDATVALENLKTVEPYSVVISDQRMPRMDGVTFPANIRGLAPATVRVLLTGQADMESAIAAVNEGNIFRFLTKPCSTTVMLKTLSACIEQHRLILAEKVLLEQTLRGSIKALIDILSLANPIAFGRATRVRHPRAPLSRAALDPFRNSRTLASGSRGHALANWLCHSSSRHGRETL